MKMVDKNLGGSATIGVKRYNQSYDNCMLESIEEMAKKFHVGNLELDWSIYTWAQNIIATDLPAQKGMANLQNVFDLYIPLIIGEAKKKVDKAFHEYKPYDSFKKEGNTWVNTGRTEIMKHATATGTPTLWNNAIAQLGVGNSATAPAATQTVLLGASQLFKGMNVGFPSTPAAQSFNTESSFGDAEALFNWLEEGFRNGARALVLWNRANTALGDKTSVTETWILTGTLTW